MPRSAGWRGAAVRGSGGGPGEAAGAHAGPRTWTPGLRPSHHNGPAHRTGNEITVKIKRERKFLFFNLFSNNREKYAFK